MNVRSWLRLFQAQAKVRAYLCGNYVRRLGPVANLLQTAPMGWILWILGLGLIAVFTLVAMGALGSLEAEDDFAEPHMGHDIADIKETKIPIALFGYRRDVVDRMLEEALSAHTHEDSPHER